ncbi:MAG: gamma-glutamyltransferase [Hyphomicrobiaceae bacterium]|nr:gamma-glutamyltransferase [Hyphomicrobiaceae bacterium]
MRGRAIRALQVAVACLFLILATSSFAAAQRTQDSPETATGNASKTAAAIASQAMISSASVLASEAGRDVLRAGGSAVDAAIAAQLVLGLVEPQSSGLGGGAFIVHWDEGRKALTSYDGRETAPAAAKPDRFFKDGKPMRFDKAVQSGLSVGVPGVVRLMETAHKAHGKLPWADLFKPAIKLAKNGFTVTPRLSLLLKWVGPSVFDDNARRYFFPGGRSVSSGDVLINPDYAATLERLAANGAQGFYDGPVAAAIVAASAKAPNAAGDMTAADLRGYAVKERVPVCIGYRVYKVCGMGPPSSGGVTVAQTLELIEGFDIGSGPGAAMSGKALHLIAEAEKLAYADRDRYIADPDFVAVPAGLTDDSYLSQRRGLINPDAAMTDARPGEPPGWEKHAFGADATLERAGTSHLSVIDAEGNAVSMTTTIEGAFGSGLFAGGFLLNNQLTDFSFTPSDKSGAAIANRVEAGKRPRSSMAPTIVFGPDGKIFAVLGSPGGPSIILYVVKSLVALLDWQYDAQAATALINFGSQGKSFQLEIGWRAIGPALSMVGYGQNVDFGLMNSGTHIVVRRDGKLEGGADPRREGAALGF